MTRTVALLVAMLVTPAIVDATSTAGAQASEECSAGPGIRSRMPLTNNIWIDVPEDWGVQPAGNTFGSGPVTGVLRPERLPARDPENCVINWMAHDGAALREVAASLIEPARANPAVREANDAFRRELDATLAALVARSIDPDSPWQNTVSETMAASFTISTGVRLEFAFFKAGSTVYVLSLRAPEGAGGLRARFLEMLASVTPWSHRNPVKKTAPGALKLERRWTMQGAAIVISAGPPGTYSFDETYITGLRSESPRRRGRLTSLGPGRIRRTTTSALGETSELCDYTLTRDEAAERDRLVLCEERWEFRW